MPSPLDKGSPWLFADAASATFAGSLGEQSPFHDLPLPSWGRLTLKPHGPLKKGSQRPLATAAASTFTGPLGEGRPFGDLPLPIGACDLRLGSRGLTGVKRRASTGTLTLPRGGPLILDGALGSTRLGHYSLVNLGALGLDHCGSRPVGSPAGATHQPGSRPQARAAPRPLPAARELRAADLLGLSVVRGPSLPELALGAPEPARAYLPSALPPSPRGGRVASAGQPPAALPAARPAALRHQAAAAPRDAPEPRLRAHPLVAGGVGAAPAAEAAAPGLGRLPAARPAALRHQAAAAPVDAPEPRPRARPLVAEEVAAAAPAVHAHKSPVAASVEEGPLVPRRRSSEPAVEVSGLWKKATKGVVKEVQGARQARREEAAEELQSAVACRDRDRIISAMGQAKAAGVDKKTVSEATRVLRRLLAMDLLEEVRRSRSAEQMRHALSRAKAAGLTSKQVEEFTEFLKQLDAEVLLIAATERAESGAIKVAIQVARSHGLEGQALATAEQKLAELEATRGLQAAMRSGQAPRIQEALQRVPCSGSEVVAEARQLLASLEGDGRGEGGGSRGLPRSPTGLARSPTGSQAGRARSPTRHPTFGLDEAGDPEEAMDETEQRLWRAISFRETGALKLTLTAAKAHGSRYASAIAQAERVLAEMEALWQLNAAAKRGDVGRLREAVERAAAAGVEEQAVGPARLLVEQVDARTALSDAVRGREPAALEAALAAAMSCGVERARIARGEEALAQLRSPPKGGSSSRLNRTETGLNRTTDTQLIRSAAVAGSRR